MRLKAKDALLRIVDDVSYRVAVIYWIQRHSTNAEGGSDWIGKKDAEGTPVMNICSGGPPVTVAIETIQFVIDNGVLPEEEQSLSFSSPDKR
jgi:hypothetical protein